MHECPDCGQACDCDGEDMEQEAPDDCAHCLGEEVDRDDDPDDDGLCRASPPPASPAPSEEKET